MRETGYKNTGVLGNGDAVAPPAPPGDGVAPPVLLMTEVGSYREQGAVAPPESSASILPLDDLDDGMLGDLRRRWDGLFPLPSPCSLSHLFILISPVRLCPTTATLFCPTIPTPLRLGGI